ncbi:MAG: SemiSWEET transporter [Pseudomonadota bacterium]
MNLNTDHLGFAAAVCTTAAFIPQVMLVWRQRGAPGVSTGMYLIFIVGVALWLAYGLAMGAWPVILANGLTLVLAGAVLGMKWYFERWAPMVRPVRPKNV